MLRARSSKALAALVIAAMTLAPVSHAASAVPAYAESAAAEKQATEFLGYIFLWYNDPECENSPDSHEVRAAYGYDGPNGLVIEYTTHWGYTTYLCGSTYKGTGSPGGTYVWHDGWVHPYWGWTNYFPENWDATQCWGGGEPC